MYSVRCVTSLSVSGVNSLECFLISGWHTEETLSSLICLIFRAAENDIVHSNENTSETQLHHCPELSPPERSHLEISSFSFGICVSC